MKRIGIGVVALLVVAGIAWAGYGMLKTRALRAHVAQVVDAASARMAETLPADVAAPSPDLVQRLEKLTGDAEGHLQELRGVRMRGERELVETADAYAGNTVAILKRQLGSSRGKLRFAESRKALAEQVARPRDDKWSAEVIRLKDRMDADYFEYRIAVTSLGNMLGELPASRAKIAALMPTAKLPDEAAIKEARARTLAAAEATRLEFEQSKQLIPR